MISTSVSANLLESNSNLRNTMANVTVAGCEFITYTFTRPPPKGRGGRRNLIQVQVGVYPFVRVVFRPFGTASGLEYLMPRCVSCCKLYTMERESKNCKSRHSLGGIQSEHFRHHQSQILHILDILVRRIAISQHPSISSYFGHLILMLHQFEHGPHQHLVVLRRDDMVIKSSQLTWSSNRQSTKNSNDNGSSFTAA